MTQYDKNQARYERLKLVIRALTGVVGDPFLQGKLYEFSNNLLKDPQIPDSPEYIHISDEQYKDLVAYLHETYDEPISNEKIHAFTYLHPPKDDMRYLASVNMRGHIDFNEIGFDYALPLTVEQRSVKKTAEEAITPGNAGFKILPKAAGVTYDDISVLNQNLLIAHDQLMNVVDSKSSEQLTYSEAFLDRQAKAQDIVRKLVQATPPHQETLIPLDDAKQIYHNLFIGAEALEHLAIEIDKQLATGFTLEAVNDAAEQFSLIKNTFFRLMDFGSVERRKNRQLLTLLKKSSDTILALSDKSLYKPENIEDVQNQAKHQSDQSSDLMHGQETLLKESTDNLLLNNDFRLVERNFRQFSAEVDGLIEKHQNLLRDCQNKLNAGEQTAKQWSDMLMLFEDQVMRIRAGGLGLA
jgi:hypothetical protein